MLLQKKKKPGLTLSHKNEYLKPQLFLFIIWFYDQLHCCNYPHYADILYILKGGLFTKDFLYSESKPQSTWEIRTWKEFINGQ